MGMEVPKNLKFPDNLLSSIRQDKYFSEKFETAVNLQLSDYFI